MSVEDWSDETTICRHPIVTDDLLQLDHPLWISILNHVAISINKVIEESDIEKSMISSLKEYLSRVDHKTPDPTPSEIKVQYTQQQVISVLSSLLTFIDTLEGYKASSVYKHLKYLKRTRKELNSKGEEIPSTLRGQQRSERNLTGNKPKTVILGQLPSSRHENYPYAGKNTTNVTCAQPTYNRSLDLQLLRRLHGLTKTSYRLMFFHEPFVRDLISKWPIRTSSQNTFIKILDRLGRYSQAVHYLMDFKKAFPTSIIRIQFKDHHPQYHVDYESIKDRLEQFEKGGLFSQEHLGEIIENLDKATTNCGPTDKKKISCYMHCEMQLLQDLTSSDLDRLKGLSRYFGCSKAPCWLCWHVLKNTRREFEMREPHLKVYARWEPPTIRDMDKVCFEDVLFQLQQELKQKFEDRSVFEHREIGPDSGPPQQRGSFSEFFFNMFMIRNRSRHHVKDT
ncbi:hypothetical protein F4779DRAFT_634973 [Xylariaceae sp. FL0662B]|nr:hypothetical protein F4779DRAFT_634973 [Xylariaceae sp. FL0662B]